MQANKKLKPIKQKQTIQEYNTQMLHRHLYETVQYMDANATVGTIGNATQHFRRGSEGSTLS